MLVLEKYMDYSHVHSGPPGGTKRTQVCWVSVSLLLHKIFLPQKAQQELCVLTTNKVGYCNEKKRISWNRGLKMGSANRGPQVHIPTPPLFTEPFCTYHTTQLWDLVCWSMKMEGFTLTQHPPTHHTTVYEVSELARGKRSLNPEHIKYSTIQNAQQYFV